MNPSLYVKTSVSLELHATRVSMDTRTWHRPKDRERLVPVGERFYGVYSPKHAFETQRVLDMQHHQAWRPLTGTRRSRSLGLPQHAG
ncbi:hypothetical protein DES53_11522 [Roseimicrobium gellanilyticum]|uniref:Uncharacterized protein n=1 Tax=Roseimicrobium gellanilyticum TaxID=748857 RepID=A0A366H5Y9_9BACT|nr:hypothetical protein DES53_11522 [Roseimicrobium gellanilyticum]